MALAGPLQNSWCKAAAPAINEPPLATRPTRPPLQSRFKMGSQPSAAGTTRAVANNVPVLAPQPSPPHWQTAQKPARREESPGANVRELRMENKETVSHTVTASAHRGKEIDVFLKAFPGLSKESSEAAEKLSTNPKGSAERTKKPANKNSTDVLQGQTLNTIKAYIKDNEKSLLSQAKNSSTNAVVIHIEGVKIDGRNCEITVTKTKEFFLHSTVGAFGKGALMEAHYALDLKSGEVVVRAETQKGRLTEAVYKQTLELTKATSKAFKGCKNVLQQHTVTTCEKTSQFGIISNLCERGTLLDNQPIALRPNAFSKLFEQFPEMKDQIKNMSLKDLKLALNEACQVINFKDDPTVELNEQKKWSLTGGNLSLEVGVKVSRDNPFVILKFKTHGVAHSDYYKVFDKLTKPAGEKDLAAFSDWLNTESKENFVINKESIDLKQVAQQMANGIREMHKEKYQHNDIKPENVFINKQGQVFVADFDQAKKLEKGSAAEGGAGTRGYIAPEAQGEDYYKRKINAMEGDIGKKVALFKNKNFLKFYQARDVFSYGVSIGQILRGTTSHPGTTTLDEYKKDEKEDDISVTDYTNKLEFDFKREFDKEPANKNSVDHLAWRCRDPNVLNRPTMEEVFKALDNPKITNF